MKDTLSTTRDLAHEAEIDQLNEEYARKRAELEVKHAREHGEEQGLHGGAADQHWASEKYGSRREQMEALIKEGIRLG